MAIFHFSAKTVSRGDARSSTAAAAYRAGEKIVDERTGEIFNYKRKGGVGPGEVILPGGGTLGRSKLWNAVEAKHRRGDAIVAREFELALPHELTEQQQVGLASDFFRSVADQYRVAVDWNLHHGHDGNLNAHIHGLMSACYCAPDGTMGKKAVELDPIHCKRSGIMNPMETQRERWQDACNAALAKAGHDARIDHRSHEARGLVEIPGQHHGPAVSGILSRGEQSDVAERQAAERATRERAQLEAQLVIARAQAAAAESELRELEAEDLAREALAVARLAQAQEKERERAQRLLIAAQDREREHAKREQAGRVALAQAHAAHDAAMTVLERAEAVEKTARKSLGALRPARNAAVAGQREAAESIFKTALAILKVPGWLKAIAIYDTAATALARAVRAVVTARESVARAWQRVLGLDPAARTTQQQIADAMTAKMRPAPVPAPAPAPALVPVVYDAEAYQDSDDEPEPAPAPRM